MMNVDFERARRDDIKRSLNVVEARFKSLDMQQLNALSDDLHVKDLLAKFNGEVFAAFVATRQAESQMYPADWRQLEDSLRSMILGLNSLERHIRLSKSITDHELSFAQEFVRFPQTVGSTSSTYSSVDDARPRVEPPDSGEVTEPETVRKFRWLLIQFRKHPLRTSGWIVVIIAIFFGTTFLKDLGSHLWAIFKTPPPPVTTENRAGSSAIPPDNEFGTVLLPTQERLLELLAKYQKEFAASKLIISRRDGGLHFDNDPSKGNHISLIKELYGIVDERASGRFEELVQSMPNEYVRLTAETRFDNPLVMSVTAAGMKYLSRKH
jgi:hypothetical protein